MTRSNNRDLHMHVYNPMLTLATRSAQHLLCTEAIHYSGQDHVRTATSAPKQAMLMQVHVVSKLSQCQHGRERQHCKDCSWSGGLRGCQRHLLLCPCLKQPISECVCRRCCSQRTQADWLVWRRVERRMEQLERRLERRQLCCSCQ